MLTKVIKVQICDSTIVVRSSCEYRCLAFCIIEAQIESVPQNNALNVKSTELDSRL